MLKVPQDGDGKYTENLFGLVNMLRKHVSFLQAVYVFVLLVCQLYGDEVLMIHQPSNLFDPHWCF